MMKYEQSIVDQINSKIQILKMVKYFNFEITTKGKYLYILCPFHNEKTPSCQVSPKWNGVCCYSCRKTAKPFDLFRTLKKLNFHQTASILTKHLKIPYNETNTENYQQLQLYHKILQKTTNYYHYLLTNNNKKHFSKHSNEALKYLLNIRKLSLETIKKFKIGFAPFATSKSLFKNLTITNNLPIADVINLGLIKNPFDEYFYDFFQNKIILPISNSQNQPIGFKAHSFLQPNQPKYFYLSNQIFKPKNHFYNFDIETIKKANQLIIHEGEFDTMQAYQHGAKNTIAIFGCDLNTIQINQLKTNFAPNIEIIIALDGDKAGYDNSLKIRQQLFKNHFTNIKIKTMPLNEDADSLIRNRGYQKYHDIIFS